MTYPETFKYTKEHEWALVEGGTATIGITHHAQHELGDIVFVDLPKAGTVVTKGQTFGSVESVKAVSDIYAPLSGEVVESNQILASSPEQLNEDPHGVAWLIKIKMAQPGEINELLSAGDYQKYVGEE